MLLRRRFRLSVFGSINATIKSLNPVAYWVYNMNVYELGSQTADEDGVVGRWVDIINDYEFIQNTTSQKPRLRDNGIEFEEVSDHVMFCSNSDVYGVVSGNDPEFTIYIETISGITIPTLSFEPFHDHTIFLDNYVERDDGTNDPRVNYTAGNANIYRVNGTTIDIWADGSQVKSAEDFDTGVITSNNLQLGRRFGAGYSSGVIVRIAIWDRALTNAEIDSMNEVL